MYLSPITVEFIGENVSIKRSFSEVSYQRIVYELLMRGENKAVIGLLSGAKNDYIIALDTSYIPSNFAESVLTHMKRGAAYVKYFQFLKGKLETTEKSDSLEYELRQSIDIAIRWNPNTVKNLCSTNLPFSIFNRFCLSARSLYMEFERSFEEQLNRE